MPLVAGYLPKPMRDNGTTPVQYADTLVDFIEMADNANHNMAPEEREARYIRLEPYVPLGYDNNFTDYFNRAYCARWLFITGAKYMGVEIIT